MSKLQVSDDIFNLFPELKIGVIKCSNLDNNIKDETKYEELLSSASKEGLKLLTNPEFSQNSVVSVWRDAYKQFKTKKGARASIEALLKRINNGNTIGTINPLVDIYNSISIKYGLPCGGEDLDTIVGNMLLTFANGNETFQTIGSEENNPPYENEIVYKDDEGAICRCFNWREAQRTMLVENTKNAILCIELIDESRTEEFNTALNELKELITSNLGGKAEIFILDQNQSEINL